MQVCKECKQLYKAKRMTSQYCSAACRVRASRVSVTDNTEVSVTEVSVTASKSLSVTDAYTMPAKPAEQQPEQMALDHYYANPDLYVTRTEPERLNWSAPMSAMELEQNGLKANRVTIPGDWDYDGVCEQVDGKWQVKVGD